MAPKKKTAKRNNWRKLCFEHLESLRKTRRELVIANSQLRSSQEGDEQVRAQILQKVEKLDYANKEVLRLSTELEEKASQLLEANASIAKLGDAAKQLVTANLEQSKLIRSLREQAIRSRRKKFYLLEALRTLRDEVTLRRRCAAVLATMHLQDNSLEWATDEFVEVAKAMGHEVGLLSPASEAYKTASRHIHRVQFGSDTKSADSYRKKLARLQDELNRS